MKALISPNEKVQYTSEWIPSDVDGIYTSVLEDITNGQKIVEISDSEFEVADPLFWVDCNNSVNAVDYYYDSSDQTIKLISDLDATEPE